VKVPAQSGPIPAQGVEIFEAQVHGMEIPAHVVEFLLILWNSCSFSGIPAHIVEFLLILWNSCSYSGISAHIVEFLTHRSLLLEFPHIQDTPRQHRSLPDNTGHSQTTKIPTGQHRSLSDNTDSY